MFEYSRAAFGKVVSDIKKLVYACDIAAQSVMIVYLFYAISTGAGKLWANIPLLVLCVGYFLFHARIRGHRLRWKYHVHA
jgi:hypothetical protein